MNPVFIHEGADPKVIAFDPVSTVLGRCGCGFGLCHRTPDHVLAAKSVLVVEDDSGLVDVISYDHIRRISFRSEVA